MAALIAAAVAVGGCEGGPGGRQGPDAARSLLPAEVPDVPAGAEMPTAQAAFETGNFGFAARYYQLALEASPQDFTACLGLAASYDWLYRFDLSDQTYSKCREMGGDPYLLFNNIGFSHILRGEFGLASVNLAQAHALRPDHPLVETNLRILHAVADA